MLRTLVPRLLCPTCREPARELELQVTQEGALGHVRDGLLTCGCGAVYPIADDLLELVPAALIEGAATPGAEFADQVAQRRHFDEFAEGVRPDYTKSRAIRASSKRYVSLGWPRFRQPGSWLLDIGCGVGVGSFPYATEHTVIGFDISRKAIRRAIEDARARQCVATTTFLVADGSFLAFRDGSFDHAQTFGALHHLPDPAATIKQIHHVLAPGGTYFAIENNASALRWIFDLAMKIRPLWIEKAGAEPLISRRMIEEWHTGLPVTIASETSYFLPPHLLNLLPQGLADWLMERSDQVLSRVPVARRHGGQLVFTITKLGT